VAGEIKKYLGIDVGGGSLKAALIDRREMYIEKVKELQTPPGKIKNF